ncbi:MAG: hypothetical protein M3439_11355 [Chloroflexota bacterium]|nr:hypothetical protein [Chloroflexota bacterium]
MQQKTRDHLATADRNRSVAIHLIDDTAREPISNEWAVVAAFYTAVHLVNAFLWERQTIEPLNHEERSRFVFMTAELRPIAQMYQRLSMNAYHARYTPEYRMSSQRASRVVTQDLATIASAVATALNRP